MGISVVGFVLGCGEPGKTPRKAIARPAAAPKRTDRRGTERRKTVSDAAASSDREIGDAPPENDPWDAKTSKERLQKSTDNLDAAMDELRDAGDPEAVADAEGRAAMALTAMRQEMASTAEGVAEYARRRTALGVAVGVAREHNPSVALAVEP